MRLALWRQFVQAMGHGWEGLLRQFDAGEPVFVHGWQLPDDARTGRALYDTFRV